MLDTSAGTTYMANLMSFITPCVPSVDPRCLYAIIQDSNLKSGACK